MQVLNRKTNNPQSWGELEKGLSSISFCSRKLKDMNFKEAIKYGLSKLNPHCLKEGQRKAAEGYSCSQYVFVYSQKGLGVCVLSSSRDPYRLGQVWTSISKKKRALRTVCVILPF